MKQKSNWNKGSNKRGNVFNSRKVKSIQGRKEKMTENALKYQAMQEEKRHNVAEEGRKEKERRLEVGKAIGQGAGSAIGAAIGAINDAKWYSANPQLVKDAASISFNNPLGAPFISDFNTKEIFPGVMVLETAHTLGDRTAIRHAAQNIYGFVRHANSGSRVYQPNDLIAYLLSMSEVYSYAGWMMRLYSLVNSAKTENRYYFDAMLVANNVNANDLRNNIAQFRTYINSFITRANTYCVPKNLSLFTRRFWMYSNIFKDQEIKKSQEYMFVPYGIGQYDDTTSTLEYKPIGNPNTQSTFNTIKTIGDGILNALLDSADIGIMSGDILKAYDKVGIHELPTINEDFHIESIYDKEVLSQIHNATIVGEHVSTSSDRIKACAFYSVYCPATGQLEQGAIVPNYTDRQLLIDIQDVPASITLGTTSGGSDGTLLNMYKDDVSPDDVMVATRLTALPTISTDPNQYIPRGTTVTLYNTTSTTIEWAQVLGTCGTEVVVRARAIMLDPNNSTNISAMIIKNSYRYVDTNINYSSLTSAEYNALKYSFTAALLLNKFDWAPFVRYLALDASSLLKMIGSTIDAANYASISNQTLSNMHYVAIQSEYGIPYIGTMIRKG